MFVLIVLSAEESIDGGERRAAVKVIGVDNGKGAVNGRGGGQDGVSRAPGLGAPFRNGVAFRQDIQLLIHIPYVKVLFHAVADGFLEFFFDGMFDDEDHGVESRSLRVEEGEIQNGVAVVIHGSDLFESSETAAHAGSHDDQCRFCHNRCSFPYGRPSRCP